MDLIPLQLPFTLPPQLRDLFRAYTREFGGNAAASEQLHGEYAWELRRDGTTAGYSWVQRSHGELYRSTLVLPEYQNQGVWSEAQWLVEQLLAQQGVETLYAQVNTNASQTGRVARRALLRAGFSLVPDEIFGLDASSTEEAILRHPAPVAFRKQIGLSAAEHQQARELAYRYALERGGGTIPPYDPARAAEEFCRAAGEIIRQRRRPRRTE